MQAHDDCRSPGDEEQPFVNPWIPLVAGLLVVGLALALEWLLGPGGMSIRVALVAVGLIAAGSAVSLRLQFPGGRFLACLPSPLPMVLLIGLVPSCPALTFFVLSRHWHVDSSRLRQAIVAMDWATLLPLVLSVVLVLAVALGVSLVLIIARAKGRALPQKLESAIVLALAGIAVGVGYLGLLPGQDQPGTASEPVPWDTVRLVVCVLMAVAYAGMLLVALPSILRRTVLVLLVVLHFSGIFTVVTSMPPAPWVTNWLYGHVSLNYLQFMYLTNAYHFYSPDPGPATLLWFQVESADANQVALAGQTHLVGQSLGAQMMAPSGLPADSITQVAVAAAVANSDAFAVHTVARRWITLPDRDNYNSRLQYFRRVAMSETANTTVYGSLNINKLLEERTRYVSALSEQIPLYPADRNTAPTQYYEPPSYTKMRIESYARHVARTYQPAADSGLRFKGVKVYRVKHEMLGPQNVLDGMDPFHPTTYAPYFQGEFDRDGNLKDAKDQFLYWLIPIVPRDKPGKGEWDDYLKVHAGAESSPAERHKEAAK